MQTLAAGIKPRTAPRGFTLLELLVVLAIIAIASAGVGMALRDSSHTRLEREAQRLVALLESARSFSRLTANPVFWRITESGFAFDGAKTADLPTAWLGSDVLPSTPTANAIVLGPEPIIGPQSITLTLRSDPAQRLVVRTDGIRPFGVVSEIDAAP